MATCSGLSSLEPGQRKKGKDSGRCRERRARHKTKDFISGAHLDIHPKIVIVEEK
jgi:hypothetical protein